MRNSIVPELESDREIQKLYEEEGLVLEVTEAICELMQKQNVKRVELAKKLDVDKSYITNLLDGNSNMTLKTISDVLFCLDSRARIQIEPLVEEVQDFSGMSDIKTSSYMGNNWQFPHIVGFNNCIENRMVG